MAIDILPHWYETLWWKLAVCLFSVLCVLAIVKVRTAFLLRQRAELESRVGERTRELNLATQQLARLASQDGLTGIANRRHFDGVLDQEIQRSHRSGEPLALLLIDVDDFKSYNDSYGHQAGDEVLREVARRCQRPLRRVTELVARYWGEEFAVILPGVGLSGAVSMANSMVAEIANARIAHRTARAAAHVTVSIGVSATDALRERNASNLIASADAALYTAKEQGRNRAVPASVANGDQPDRAARGDPAVA
jgi:diguanylate cyclase (GGDEF)-like protein